MIKKVVLLITLLISITLLSNQGKSQSNKVIVLLHGLSPNQSDGMGHDCNTYFGKLKPKLRQKGWDEVTLSYYKRSYNCGITIASDPRMPKLDVLQNRGPDSDADFGTNNVDYRFTAYNFAWYLYNNFRDKEVIVVAHSLGGLIARHAVGAVHSGYTRYPESLPIKKLFTVQTPNDGAEIINLCFKSCDAIRKNLIPNSEALEETNLVDTINSYNSNVKRLKIVTEVFKGANTDSVVSLSSQIGKSAPGLHLQLWPLKVQNAIDFSHIGIFNSEEITDMMMLLIEKY